MSEHGFLKPNPVLFDLERLKPRAQLGHEVGLGAPCQRCHNKCSGFELHYWKKVCMNCRCGKIEHGVLDQTDHGKYLVGKIFDRPLRTKEEEYSFIYGSVQGDPEPELRLDWAPPGVSRAVVSRYLESLTEEKIPVPGSEAAVRRIKQLEKQFPLHDVEPEMCHQLTQGEIDKMSSYVDNVKRNVAGQGILTQLGRSSPSPPPVMPPPMKLLPIARKSGAQYLTERSWSCGGCGEEMEAGQVAIFAERAGEDSCWHPDCFCCWECGELLEDLLYYYSQGHLYCGRHFAAQMKIPRCSACDELIFSAEFTQAEERFWHLKHFCCWLCDLPLAGHQYIGVEGMPHCLQCWQEQHGKTCLTCNLVIHPKDKRVSLGDQNWHAVPGCFQCWVCGHSLVGGKMCLKQGKPLCSSVCAVKLLANTSLSYTSSGTVV